MDNAKLENIWKEKIEKNKATRIPWKRLLGTSLTKLIISLHKRGFTQKNTLLHILYTLNTTHLYTFLHTHPEISKDDVYNRIAISVSSRYAEAKMHESVSR